MIHKVLITSNNPVKINATIKAFKELFPDNKYIFENKSVPSSVSNQPMSEEETFKGAFNRVNYAFDNYKEYDYWVGIEGGIEVINDEMLTFAWVYIKGKDKVGKARSASFILPKRIVDLIREGKELGEADDIVFKDSNSKQKNGAIGILTNNLITRTDLYFHPVIMALLPFFNKKIY